MVNFLADLYKEGYQYRSLNSYQSAISSYHDGLTVGEHPMVSRLMKGAFNNRPPLPKHCRTWRVKTVLDFLEGLGENKELPLMQLTWKMVMILALPRPSRSADLSSLDISKRTYIPEGVKFTPATLAKQSGQGKDIKDFFFHSFPENKSLCPVERHCRHMKHEQPQFKVTQQSFS